MPVTYRSQSGSDPSHLIVFLEGAQQTRREEKITPTLTKYGDMLMVDYLNGRFDAADIVRQICNELASLVYPQVTFIGTSLGGLLAHDIIQEMGRRKKGQKFQLILLDAPTGAVDLRNKKAHLTRFVPQIWTPKWVNRLPFLYRLGQVRYIVRHPGPQKTVLGDVPMVFIRSSANTIIERNTPANWGAATDRDVLVITAQTAFQADLLEFPAAWARCITVALNILNN